MCCRLFWALAVLAATAVLIYVIVMNIFRLRGHEKTVSVDVTFANELDFPAITICNQNQFRYGNIDYGPLWIHVSVYLFVCLHLIVVSRTVAGRMGFVKGQLMEFFDGKCANLMICVCCINFSSIILLWLLSVQKRKRLN